jgi:hypothetical protein
VLATHGVLSPMTSCEDFIQREEKKREEKRRKEKKREGKKGKKRKEKERREEKRKVNHCLITELPKEYINMTRII